MAFGGGVNVVNIAINALVMTAKCELPTRVEQSAIFRPCCSFQLPGRGETASEDGPMNLLIHCWRYNCKKLVRKKSAREVVAVQVRVDSVDVRVSWSSRLVFVVTVWLSGDDHAAAFATFLTSCKPFLNNERQRDHRLIYDGLFHVCRRAVATKIASVAEARIFFEENFRPVRIASLGKSTGLLTGYYEPIVDGSRFPSPEFHWPLYRRPPDLLVNGKKPGAAGVPNRAAVGRLTANKQVQPYYDRLAIENGALDGQHLEICWLRDPLEAMSIEIEGSVRVRLEDGTLLRLAYDAHNGFSYRAIGSYKAIGRVLVERKLIPRQEISMERIKRWMQANPEQAKEVRGTNRSLVFFRITGLDMEDEPAGAQGVPLSRIRLPP